MMKYKKAFFVTNNQNVCIYMIIQKHLGKKITIETESKSSLFYKLPDLLAELQFLSVISTREDQVE